MITITDSNIIYSALIAPNGTVAKILKAKSNIQFIAPDYLLKEVKNHIDKIIANSTLQKKDLQAELNYLISRIKFIKVENIPKKDILASYEITKDIDPYDAFFVALYLYKKHKIWTMDKVLINGLLKKGYDICITTAQLKKQLFKKVQPITRPKIIGILIKRRYSPFASALVFHHG